MEDSRFGQERGMAEGYTDHFVIFADLLGFGEAMAGLNAERRLRTLNLLTSLAALRGNFSLTAIPSENGGLSRCPRLI